MLGDAVEVADGLVVDVTDGEVDVCGAVGDTLTHGVGNTVVVDGVAAGGVMVGGTTVVVVSGAVVVAGAHGSTGAGET